MCGEVAGFNTLKLIKKNTTGIAFALSVQRSTRRVASLLSASGNLAEAHTHAVGRRNVAGADLAHTNSTPANSPAVSTGTVNFAEPSGAEIYVDGQLVGNIPSTIQLHEGNYEVQVKYGKSPDWLKNLQVHACSAATLRAQFPAAP